MKGKKNDTETRIMPENPSVHSLNPTVSEKSSASALHFFGVSQRLHTSLH
jgi:hypothetical protein